jgi:hypothetical protein
VKSAELDRRPIRAGVIATVLFLIAGLASVWAPTAHAATPTVPGTFGAVKPARVLDTRGSGTAVLPFGTITVPVLGIAGVPATGVSAVVLNVTATDAKASGALTVWASGTPQPRASNLQFGVGKTVPNQVIAPVGADGRVALHNGSGGYLQLVADVSGYFTSGAATTAGTFSSLAPARVLDTRNGTGVHAGPVPAHGLLALPVAGHGGVPATGASAVVLNLTVTGPKATGVLTAWANGGAEPLASNLNFTHGQTIANLVVVPLGANGRVSLLNRSGGALELVADVAGYFVGGAPTDLGAFSPVAPARLLDTRIGNGAVAQPVPSHGTISVQIAGRGGVPSTGVSAVEINVTATGGSTHGVITVWPSGTTEPTASNLNYNAAQTVPNLVLAPLGPDGKIQFNNNSGGTVNLVADVAGYFLGAALPVPTATTSRYVRNITGAATDASTLNTEGCTDAQANGAGAHFGLLQLGAQTVTAPLSATDPGVLLTGTQTRLDYAKVVTALTGYTDGYSRCATAGSTLALAIGTSTDGDFTAYAAAAKGADWATKVIAPVQAHASSAISVEAAVDIEASFAATEAQAEQWEGAYLDSSTTKLVMNGSADACPATFAATGQACGPVTSSIGAQQIWTQAQYYRLAFALSPTRLEALPQIYSLIQAGQWADIAQTGASSTQHIDFLGALTESSACGATCSVVPAQGWAALYLSLASSTLTTPASLPVSTDLRSDT